MKPPYFKGQKPSKCGHYYPDTLRNFDNLSESGKIVERNCYCFKCKKKYIIRFRLSSIHEPEKLFFEKVKSLKELQKMRIRELKRLQKTK